MKKAFSEVSRATSKVKEPVNFSKFRKSAKSVVSSILRMESIPESGCQMVTCGCTIIVVPSRSFTCLIETVIKCFY